MSASASHATEVASFDEVCKCYRLGTKTMRGITYDLEQCFWAHWSPAFSRLQAEKEKHPERFPVASEPKKPKLSEMQKRMMAANGQIVAVPLPWGSSSAKIGSRISAGVAAWANGPKNRPPNQYAKAVADWCAKNNVKPLMGEFAVADAETGYATGVDLVVERKELIGTKMTNVLELVEIKYRSRSSWYETAGQMMRAPLKDLDASPYSQALVQLAVTAVLFEKYNPRTPIFSVALCRVDRSGTVTYDRHSWKEISVVGRVAYKAILEHRRKVKQEKRLKRKTNATKPKSKGKASRPKRR